MKLKLPIKNAILSPLAAKHVCTADALVAVVKHCYGQWEHLPAAERRDRYCAVQRHDAVSTPFTDRNGVSFIVATDAAWKSTVVKLPSEP